MSFVAISLDAAHKILRLKRHSGDHFFSKKMKIIETDGTLVYRKMATYVQRLPSEFRQLLYGTKRRYRPYKKFW